MGKVSDDEVGSAARSSWHAARHVGVEGELQPRDAAGKAVSTHAVSNDKNTALRKSWNCMCWWKTLFRPRCSGNKALSDRPSCSSRLRTRSSSQRKIRQPHDAQAAVALASETMRSILASLSEVTATSAVAVSPELQYPSSESSLRNISYGMNATRSAHFIVVSRICDLVNSAKGVDSDVFCGMQEGVYMLYSEMTEQFQGLCLYAQDGYFRTQFPEVATAVTFALRLRRAVSEALWPDEVLALPGCEPEVTVDELSPPEKGPRLQILIDWGISDWSSEGHWSLCSMALPNQILLTGAAWSQLAKTDALVAAGFPDIRPLGTFSHGDFEVAAVMLLEVSEPCWDSRLPQIRHQRVSERLEQVSGAPKNMWPLPADRFRGTSDESRLAVAAVQIDPLQAEDNVWVSANVRQIVHDAVTSMCLIFGGYMTGHTSDIFDAKKPLVTVFGTSDCALAFSVCVQKFLLHARWREEDLELWGGREHDPLGRLIFSGPRAKIVVDMQPTETMKFVQDPGSTSTWAASRLLRATHPGQILATERASGICSVTSCVDRLRMYDMGAHLLNATKELFCLKEIQLMDAPRPLRMPNSFEAVSSSYIDSPSTGTACAFVHTRIACPGGSRGARNPAFLKAVGSWRSLVSGLVSKHGGYEILLKGTVVQVVFPDIKAALRFSLDMQTSMLEMPVPEELLQMEDFRLVHGSQDQVLFKGLRAKIGISCGVPALRFPSRKTGRAYYAGAVVKSASYIMSAACPGQILVEGEVLVSNLGIPADRFDPFNADEAQTAIMVPIHSSGDPGSGITTALVRPLGLFNLKGFEHQWGLQLADLVSSDLCERNFSLPPGRIGAALHSACGQENWEDVSYREASLSGSLLDIISVMDNILDESKPEITYNSEERVESKGVLGRGKFGRVELGQWKGHDVAFKQFTCSGELDKRALAEIRAMFEVSVSAAMSHPNIVQIYSYGVSKQGDRASNSPRSTSSERPQSSGKNSSDSDLAGGLEAESPGPNGPVEFHWIQELCDMKTLRENLESAILCEPGKRLPDTRLALRLAHDVACGMLHMHSQNVIHGDLSASMVMLSTASVWKRTSRVGRGAQSLSSILPDAMAKIADAGLCVKFGEPAIEAIAAGIVDNGAHVAPEVFLDKANVSKEADVYSFGILLYNLFSGKRAFDGLSKQEVMERVLAKRTVPVFPAEVLPGIRKLAESCLEPASARPAFEAICCELERVIVDMDNPSLGVVSSSSSAHSHPDAFNASQDGIPHNRRLSLDVFARHNRVKLRASKVSFEDQNCLSDYQNLCHVKTTDYGGRSPTKK